VVAWNLSISVLHQYAKKPQGKIIMDAYQQLIATIALTMGASWASGINLYATICTLGILGASGNIVLPEQLHVLQDPLVIGAACLMYFVEFFADKTPGVDTGWDVIHSFIRIPAGVMLAAGAVGDVNPGVVIAAGILGGTVSATSHFLKAGSRVLINTSPEPFSNWIASILEDISVIGGLYIALRHPWVFLVCLVLFLLFASWFLPKLWASIRAMFSGITRLFRNKQPSNTSQKGSPPEIPV
jgi:hypothetical protein